MYIENNCFGVEITPEDSHMTSKICRSPVYFVTELTGNTGTLQWKDWCKISQRLFAVISQMAG